MATFVQDYELFDLGEFGLQSGQVIHGAKLAYKTSSGRASTSRTASAG
jgi:hypothetical protein